MAIENCTRCGEKLGKFRINTILHIDTQRLKENGVWENIPNLDNTSKEILCEKCFNEFAEILENMNIKYEE